MPESGFMFLRKWILCMMSSYRIRWVLPFLLSPFLYFNLFYPSFCSASNIWREFSRGLEFGTFETGKKSLVGDGKIRILRIDPNHWEFILLSQSRIDIKSGLTARSWCLRHGLVAAINAGMFHPDYTTHVGYMKVDTHLNNKYLNQYQSLAAFSPYSEKLRPFYIYDLDRIEEPLKDIQKNYRFVVQNLRLIKRPAINRWPEQQKMWSEAALGQDRKGRVLFIFSRTPYSMYQLNKILLSLPIELVCAQHLEGGPEAQLFVKYQNVEIEEIGSFETNFKENDTNLSACPVPNVIGVREK